MLSKKIIPKKARFERTRLIAQKFVLEHNISYLPVNPFEIAKKINITIITATEYATIMQKPFGHVIKNIIKSNDGAAKKTGSVQFILYNEKIQSKGRIRWTLMHEIGHIILNHLDDFEETQICRGGLSKEQYSILEQEAHFFASQILAPPVILDALNLYTIAKIRNMCGLSNDASEKRLTALNKWKKRRRINAEEWYIKKQFHNFIHKKFCKNCEFGFIHTYAVYCPMCGKKLKWGDGKLEYNDGYKINEDGRALMCPRCDNENLSYDGDYCSICGAYLVNECPGEYDNNGNLFIESCGPALNGSARHCHKCGRSTTFYNQQFLLSWYQIHTNTTKKIMEISDDDLPF